MSVELCMPFTPYEFNGQVPVNILTLACSHFLHSDNAIFSRLYLTSLGDWQFYANLFAWSFLRPYYWLMTFTRRILGRVWTSTLASSDTSYLTTAFSRPRLDRLVDFEPTQLVEHVYHNRFTCLLRMKKQLPFVSYCCGHARAWLLSVPDPVTKLLAF